MNERADAYSGEFVAAMLCFVAAAAAGVWMRLVWVGIALPEPLVFENLRRAHSHLMLFGWVTPALFALIAAHAAPSRAIRRILQVTLVLGVLSFPPFLWWGYGSAPIGSAKVPLSVIVSTLSMFAWYAFAVAYVKLRPQLRERCGDLSIALWDGSMALLVLGSAGAWARGALIGMKVDDLFLAVGVIEFFLTSFADGFLTLGVMGLLFVGAPAGRGVVLPARLLAVVLPFEFLALMPPGLVPPDLRVVGAVAVVITGIIVTFYGLRLGSVAGLIVAGLGASKLLLVSPVVAAEILAAGLRIPYLHVLLLGFVSWTLFREANARWPHVVRNGPIGPAIAVMLACLWPTTSLWPEALPRDLGFLLTALSSCGPVLAAIWMLRGGGRRGSYVLAEHSSCPRSVASS